MAEIRVGTSGWHYASWKGPFFPSGLKLKDQLGYYATQFRTTELNGVFYRTPTREAVTAWRQQTPREFVFAWKASKFITHWKRLSERSENSLELLEDRLSLLGPKAGPVLFQLPPRWKVKPERLESLLEILPRQHRYAFEFRETSWMVPEINRILRRFNAAFCIYELAGYHSPIEVTADFAYVRLHGPEDGKYQGSYSNARLTEWARQIKDWAAHLKAVHVYFDNDQAGYAPKNALTLKKMVLGKSAQDRRAA